jgi:ribosomal protein S18 acetylase RimI-like enzyme
MRDAQVVVRPLAAEDADACDAIVLSHPEHFGHEGGRQECARAVRETPGLVAVVDGKVVGFLTLARHFDQSAEITWMAVHAGWRGRGIGKRLVERLADDLRANGCRLLLVMTLAESDDASRTYHDTRAFYRSAGFIDARELPDYWPGTTALMLVRPLTLAS